GTAQPQGLQLTNNHHSEPFAAIPSGATVSNNTQTTPALLRSGALALPYLSTAAGSALIDKGTNSLPTAPLAMTYSGNGPDIGAYESGGTGIANQLPTVSLGNPVANASYPTGSSINLIANASDADGSIAKVEFYAGSTKVGEKTSSPYSFSWNVTTAGSYALTAKATDNAGGVTTSAAINVTITAPNQAPSIAISSPSNNTSFTSGNAITITASATDSDGKVSKVEFFAGTSKIGESTTSPYTLSWTPSAAGTYAITAKATDDKTGVATSTIVSVIVNAINIPPVVSLTAPTANATFTTGNVTLTANASDSDGSIAKVEFFAGSTKLGEKTTSPYSITWSAATAGTYAITAKATDNKGGVTTSTAVNVTITAPNKAPVVAITSPSNTTLTLGSAVSITANASDSDGAIAKVEFFAGSTKLGEKTTSPYTLSWTPSAAGTYAITAKATDNKGSVTTSSAVSLVINAPANKAPIVSLTSPSANAGYQTGVSFTVAANASDADGSIAKVEFYAGAVKIGEKTASPYSITWSTATVGTYALTAKATDNKGSVTTSSTISVIVSAQPTANKLPVVSLTNPVANASYPTGSSINLTANASDADGSIAKVEFFAGSTKVGEKTSSPYSFSWNVTTAGSYALTAKATDNKGGVSTSTAVNVTITAPNQAPVVAITSPSNNTSFTSGNAITITASATDSDGKVSKVEFFAGTSKIGESTTSPYTLNWTPSAAGTYAITAKATDDKTGVATSTIVSVIVNASTPTATTGDGLNGELYTQFGFSVAKTRIAIAGQTPTFTFGSSSVDYPNGSTATSSYTNSWGSWLGKDGSGAPGQTLETSTLRLHGYLEVKPEYDVVPGNSTIDIDFTLFSQGFAALTVNGIQVTLNEANWTFSSQTARVSFAGAGFYTIEIVQSMCWDNSGVELYSSIPGTENPGRGSSATPTIVPQSVLYKKIPTATASNSGRIASSSLVAYPNPSNGDQVAFKIDDQSQNGQDMVVTFYNLNGNVALQQTAEVIDGIVQLQNLGLNRGMYTVTVKGQKGIQHSKVVIQ
ncbi:Ig-like domain-containing protein, partial [Xanthocytophaga flava]|uniref:Ig-like domain-containing protein n=1 Tax=Xanthocytophaga flava TaxID=3048013 RepID=UPI0028D66E9A